MDQLLAHLFGDYLLQNHWMANTKKRSSLAALIHVTLYGLPFLLLTRSLVALGVVVATHFIIDRFSIAALWVDFWGTGKEGRVTGALMRLRGWERVGDEWHIVMAGEGGGGLVSKPAIKDAPPFLGVWLIIIVDNTMHLCINYGALRWL